MTTGYRVILVWIVSLMLQSTACSSESSGGASGAGGTSGTGGTGGVAGSAGGSGNVIDTPSRFGMVKGGSTDLTLSPGWLKTIWTPQAWDETTAALDAGYWQTMIQERRALGLIEVPLVAGATWDSGDLPRISEMMTQFFEAEPNVPVWELGLEENLRAGWEGELDVTAQKLAAVQQVKDAINPDIRLAYQIANLGTSDLSAFLASSAADHIEILSLHPYPWPDFLTPELWHDAWLAEVKSLMAAHNRDYPIWYSEIGAPQNDANVPQMYSGGTSPVRGQSHQENAIFMVKLHAMALAGGVDRVFWYEYQDGCTSTTDVECHFAMIDYDGNPKPAYEAHQAMMACMNMKEPAGAVAPASGTRVYSFAGATEDCLVVWNYPDATSTAELSSLRSDLTPGNTHAVALLGAGVDVSGERSA